MEIATAGDRTVRRERTRVIVSQSLSLYRSLSCSLARCVALARLCSLFRCVLLGSATSTPARQHGKIWHHLSSMALFFFFGFFEKDQGRGRKKSENQSLSKKHVVRVRKRSAKGEWESVCSRRSRAYCIFFSICHTFAGGNRFCFCFCNAACFHPAGFSSIACGCASILWLLCFLSLAFLRGS